jgi:hypothetical protein
MRPLVFVACVVLLAACAKQEAPPTRAATAATDSSRAQNRADCAATGLWSACQVFYRLERAGVAPKIDSSATPAEKLTGRPLIMKIGLKSMLEVYIYPDAASRIADEKTLDRPQFVMDSMPQTINHERTIIESVNLLGLLTSLDNHQRERVSDALTAGPPQPAQK